MCPADKEGRWTKEALWPHLGFCIRYATKIHPQWVQSVSENMIIYRARNFDDYGAR